MCVCSARSRVICDGCIHPTVLSIIRSVGQQCARAALRGAASSLSLRMSFALSLSLCLDPLSDKQPLRPCPSICLAKRCFLAAHQGGPSAHVAESTAITASLLALLGGWDGRYLRQTGATVVVFSLSGNHTRGASPRVEVCDVSIIMFFGSINELEGDVGCVEGVSDDAPPGMAALWT